MPVYEYEHLYDESELCDFRFAVVQSINEEPLSFCPSCGLEVKRVISQAAMIKTRNFKASDAAKRGFTTWKKSGEGEWEKVDGPGVDAIVGTDEDKQAIKESQRKVVNLSDG